MILVVEVSSEGYDYLLAPGLYQAEEIQEFVALEGLSDDPRSAGADAENGNAGSAKLIVNLQ